MATIEGGNTIRAVGGGSAVVTVVTINGKKASLQLTVPQLPTRIALSPASAKLGEGERLQLTASMPEGQGCVLRYESSNPAVASVDANGLVCALTPGSACIRVYTQNDLTAQCDIRVMKAPSGVSLTPNRAARRLDEGSFQLSVRYGSDDEGGQLTFSSSDTAVASVDGNGLVRFHSAGEATIRVETYNGHLDSCRLSVGEQPGKIYFSPAEISVAQGDSVSLPVAFDKGCESYTLSSSDTAIVEVSGEGVRGVAQGEAVVTATSRSGLTAQCRVTVVAPPEGISLEPMQARIVVGVSSTLQLQASTLPSGVGSIYFTSSAPEIASVERSTGLVTPKSAGSCTIRATTYDGRYSAECTLEVARLLDGVKIGIDPGHQAKGNSSTERSSPKGGSSKAKVSDGATGRSTKVKEHVTNLQVGLKLRDALEALGAEVYMTRETANVNISNQQRAKMMNAYGVDLVLRLHCNSTSSSSVNGIMLYIRKSCAYGSDVVDGAALLASETRAAKALMAEMPKATGAKAGKIVRNNVYTGNNWSTVPCILVEMGYNSNPKEDRLLNSSAYQDKLVQGMINGICVYMGRDLPAQ